MIWTDSHSYDGTRQHSDASYEGTAYVCACGERFVEKSDCLEHVRELGDCDLLQIKLAIAYSTYLVHTGPLVGSRVAVEGFWLEAR